MKLVKQLLNTIPRPFLIRLSLWVRPFLDVFYRGRGFIDPINGKSYRKFLPYGYGLIRKNALSPGTFSLERHRLLWLYLKTVPRFFAKSNVILHVAPEQCFIGRFKAVFGENYVTTDLFSPIVDVKADICDLPFDGGFFDVVFCNHVLEHIEDDAKALSEIFRVLKPGGWAILQVPQNLELAVTYEDAAIVDPNDRKIHFGQYDHVRVYGKDYFGRLTKAGFNVQPFSVREHFTTKEIIQYGLMHDEILPVVYKT